MSALRCAEIRRELEWFVGDELPAERTAAVRAHLCECVSCRRAAGSLQQAIKSLRGAAAEVPVGVDEGMFTTMHAAIVARIRVEELGDVTRSLWRRRVLPLAAAVGLFVFGWWLVRTPGSLSVFERAPIGMTVGREASTQAPAFGVPAVPLRLLGDEDPIDRPHDGFGAGMMGRWRLRTLEGVDPAVPSDRAPRAVRRPADHLR